MISSQAFKLLLIPFSPNVHLANATSQSTSLTLPESDSAPTSVVVSSGSGSSSQPTSALLNSHLGVAVGMGAHVLGARRRTTSAFVTGIMNKTASGILLWRSCFALRGVLSFVFDVSLMSDCMDLDNTCSAASDLSAWCSRRKPLAASDAVLYLCMPPGQRTPIRYVPTLGLLTCPTAAHPIHLNQSFHITDSAAR